MDALTHVCTAGCKLLLYALPNDGDHPTCCYGEFLLLLKKKIVPSPEVFCSALSFHSFSGHFFQIVIFKKICIYVYACLYLHSHILSISAYQIQEQKQRQELRMKIWPKNSLFNVEKQKKKMSITPFHTQFPFFFK